MRGRTFFSTGEDSSLAEGTPYILFLSFSHLSVHYVTLSLSLPPPPPHLSAGACDVYGATGGSVTLKLGHTLTESQVLKWTHDSAVIFERSPSMLITGTKNDIHANGSLWLQNLTTSKNGKYKPEIFEDGQSKGNLKAINLCVLGR